MEYEKQMTADEWDALARLAHDEGLRHRMACPDADKAIAFARLAAKCTHRAAKLRAGIVVP